MGREAWREQGSVVLCSQLLGLTSEESEKTRLSDLDRVLLEPLEPWRSKKAATSSQGDRGGVTRKLRCRRKATKTVRKHGVGMAGAAGARTIGSGIVMHLHRTGGGPVGPLHLTSGAVVRNHLMCHGLRTTHRSKKSETSSL